MKIILSIAIILSSNFCLPLNKTNDKLETVNSTEKPKLMGKGFLLSAKKTGKEWTFRLAPNFNRDVNDDEIKKAIGVENTKKMFETIAANETIAWISSTENPSPEILFELSQHCKKLNLKTQNF
ncbi:MAG: hypothetical protein SFU98_22780 [Leptospiraceae bacterium]|nr:hypothetical protein [Leptospiraceae bacterium]